MNKTDNRDIELIDYPNLNKFDDLLSFTSTRTGGVSIGNYESLNLSFHSGDDIQNANVNRERLCNHLRISQKQLIVPFQTHGNTICLIDNEFLSLDKETQTSLLNGIDATITNIPEVCLIASTADCVPILIYDPVNKAIAAIHAGWRGTCSRIVLHTVSAMESAFQTNAKDLFVAIGPSISPEVYEVGTELMNVFQENEFDIHKIFIEKEKKLHLDLWQANKDVLISKGVMESNIYISGYCTYLNFEKFFSARRHGIRSGRMFSGIMLR